jgi:hypothetical protein
MIIAPPEYGYGENGNPQAKIKGTDTLVFVVDGSGSGDPVRWVPREGNAVAARRASACSTC